MGGEMFKNKGLSQATIIGLLFVVFLLIIAVIYLAQMYIEKDVLIETNGDITKVLEQHEISKLAAEIRKIRSDTSGSLFLLKLIGLFVTVGGAVGGYLIGQSRTTRQRIQFDNRRNIENIYQAMVQELSSESPILRAAAAVKMGDILASFPEEWKVSQEMQKQLILLTKKILAASLAIENDPKVLKTLTIALVQHRPWTDDIDKKGFADAQGLDISGTTARDAYWARVDFTYADFYKADLTQASFRAAILKGVQFRETIMSESVLVRSDCEGANFKMADLRGANFSEANLRGANFEQARVYGTTLTNAKIWNNPDAEVDISKNGDGSETMRVHKWLESQGATQSPSD